MQFHRIIGTLRRSLIAFLVFIAGILVVISGGRLLTRRADVPVPSLFRQPSEARLLLSMDGFHFAQIENGSVAWRITAHQADLFENKEARLRAIENDFAGSDSRRVTLIGDMGELNTVTGSASIKSEASDVRVLTSDGYLLTTSSLLWDAAEEQVRTSDPFKLLGAAIYLEGKGFSAKTDLRQIMVNKNVKAVLQE